MATITVTGTMPTTAMGTATGTEPPLVLGTPAAFLGALRLGSAALPIGAFAYSQGLERAVETLSVRDRASASRWIGGVLENTLLTSDVPVLVRISRALAASDTAAADSWSDFLYATRGTEELRAEELQLGRSLYRFLERLGAPDAQRYRARPRATLAGAFALAGLWFGLDASAAALSYAFAWCESQVGAASRLVPLGQSDAQLVLSDVVLRLGASISRSLALEDDEIGATAPGQTLLSAAHETQYSRLFRS